MWVCTLAMRLPACQAVPTHSNTNFSPHYPVLLTVIGLLHPRPVLDAVWDPYTKDLNHLEKVQKRAVHFVCGTFSSHSEECISKMIKSLDWDSLANRHKIRVLTVFQQARQGHISLPVETLLQPVQLHSRHLHANVYSFFPRAIIDWNSLPEPITNISST